MLAEDAIRAAIGDYQQKQSKRLAAVQSASSPLLSNNASPASATKSLSPSTSSMP